MYSVVVVDRDDDDVEKGLKAVVGKYRHAWIVGWELEVRTVVKRVQRYLSMCSVMEAERNG